MLFQSISEESLPIYTIHLGYYIKLLRNPVYKSEYLDGAIANDEWNTMTQNCGITRIQNHS